MGGIIDKITDFIKDMLKGWVLSNLETMFTDVKTRLIDMLCKFIDIFSWSYHDMPGLDANIVVHRLPLKEEFPSVKQKLRRMRPDMSKKIKDEVQKQFDAGFLEVTSYPPWVANIVPVPKKDGKVRVCVDYHDLNRASPKEDLPLPHIDVFVRDVNPAKIKSIQEELRLILQR